LFFYDEFMKKFWPYSFLFLAISCSKSTSGGELAAGRLDAEQLFLKQCSENSDCSELERSYMDYNTSSDKRYAITFSCNNNIQTPNQESLGGSFCTSNQFLPSLYGNHSFLVQDPCFADSDCLSNFCGEHGACQPAETSKPYTFTCYANRDCVSNLCIAPKNGDPGACSDSSDGSFCTNDKDCISGICLRDRSTCSSKLPLNATCSRDLECASERCTDEDDGTCEEKAALGGLCFRNSSCQTGKCFLVPVGIGKPLEGQCLALEGESCETNTVCASNNCQSTKCVGKLRSGLCLTNSDCMSHLWCLPRGLNCVDGVYCNNENDCDGNPCIRNVCAYPESTDPCLPGTPIAESCTKISAAFQCACICPPPNKTGRCRLDNLGTKASCNCNQPGLPQQASF
jgi:hypothetical protein